MNTSWLPRVLMVFSIVAAVSLGSSPVSLARPDLLSFEGVLTILLAASAAVSSWRSNSGELKLKVGLVLALLSVPFFAYSASRFMYTPYAVPQFQVADWIKEARWRGLQGALVGLGLLFVGLRLLGHMERNPYR